jgi:hypothetical protein
MIGLTNHIEHAFPCGKLSFDIGVDDGATSMIARFECASTGAMYESFYVSEAIGQMHKVFINMPELLVDFIEEEPTLICEPEVVRANWGVLHGKRLYEFEIKVAKKVYQPNEISPVEMMQDIRVLKKQVARQEETIKALVEFILTDGVNMPSARGFELMRKLTLATGGMSEMKMECFPLEYLTEKGAPWQERIDFFIEQGMKVEHMTRYGKNIIFELIEGASIDNKYLDIALYLVEELEDINKITNNGKSLTLFVDSAIGKGGAKAAAANGFDDQLREFSGRLFGLGAM